MLRSSNIPRLVYVEYTGTFVEKTKKDEKDENWKARCEEQFWSGDVSDKELSSIGVKRSKSACAHSHLASIEVFSDFPSHLLQHHIVGSSFSTESNKLWYAITLEQPPNQYWKSRSRSTEKELSHCLELSQCSLVLQPINEQRHQKHRDRPPIWQAMLRCIALDAVVKRVSFYSRVGEAKYTLLVTPPPISLIRSSLRGVKRIHHVKDICIGSNSLGLRDEVIDEISSHTSPRTFPTTLPRSKALRRCKQLLKSLPSECVAQLDRGLDKYTPELKIKLSLPSRGTPRSVLASARYAGVCPLICFTIYSWSVHCQVDMQCSPGNPSRSKMYDGFTMNKPHHPWTPYIWISVFRRADSFQIHSSTYSLLSPCIYYQQSL